MFQFECDDSPPLPKAIWQSIIEKTCAGRDWLGWFHLPPVETKPLAAELSSWRGDADFILVIGIGGSYLGAHAVASALGHELCFAGTSLSTLDRHSWQRRLRAAKNPRLVVISKSGTTLEPAVAMNEAMTIRNFAPNDICFITDGHKGILRPLAREKNILSYVVPDDVGGRYSVFTHVGLVPLYLAGVDIQSFVQGSQDVFKAHRNGVDQSALYYGTWRAQCFERGARIEVLAYDVARFSAVVEWWKQLFGESEGKQHRGMLPVGVHYTADLHSLGQWMQEGPRIVCESFWNIGPQDETTIDLHPWLRGHFPNLQRKSYRSLVAAATQGTRVAHKHGQVPTSSARLEALDAYHLGAWMAWQMIACAVSALSLGVNPFDQPGVESYKKEMHEILNK